MADSLGVTAEARCQKWCVQLLDKDAAILCCFNAIVLGPSNIDLRTAEAARTPACHLRRQLVACFPHGELPRLVRTVLPVLNEVGLRDLGQANAMPFQMPRAPCPKKLNRLSHPVKHAK